MFSNIALHYGKDLGILYKIVIDTAFNGTAKSNHLTKTITFNDNPTIDGGYNRYNQMLSILYHEHMHIQSKRGDDSDPCGHVEYAYISQMMHKETFSRCSEAFRLQILGLCSCYLINCISEPAYKGGGKENFEKMHDKIKEIYRAYGFFFAIYKKDANTIKYIIKKIKYNQLITDKECEDTINH